MALAVAAIDSAHRLGMPVHTVTVDHRIRPESADEAAAVASYLEKLGASAHVCGTKALEGGDGPEGNARTLRYASIGACARALRVQSSASLVLVLLGHTMDDQAETVLLRLARGSGVGSLKAMAEAIPFHTAYHDIDSDESTALDAHETTVGSIDDSGIVLLRPLLGVRRADTLAFCRALHCPIVDDPTNALDGPWRSADGTPLRRSAIRHGVLPAAREALGMDPVPALARTAALARDDDEALEVWAQRAFAQAREHSPSLEGLEGCVALNIAPLCDLPRSVRRRVLRRACLRAGAPAGNMSAEHLKRIDDLVSSWNGQGPLHLPRLRVWRIKTPDGRPFLLLRRLTE